MWLATARVWVRFWRTTKTLRWSFASQPTSGHCETSLLAMNETGATAEMTGMSSQETWLQATSSGRWCETSPMMRMRTPRSRHSIR